jgi:hypothetical protein
MQRQANEFLQQAAAQPSLLPTPPEMPDAEGLKAASKRLTDAIFSGEEDQTQEAIQELMVLKTPTGQPVSQDVIKAMIQSTVAESDSHRALTDARTAFARDFSDVNSDPDLKELANIKTVTIQRAHPDWTPSQVLTQAGEEVMSKIKSVEPTPDPEPQVDVDALKGRRESKRSTTTLKSAAGRVPTPPAPKPPTKADVVADMRTRRVA